MTLIWVAAAVTGCRSPDRPAPTDQGVSSAVDARLRDARSGPVARDPDVLGRAGPVTLDRAGFRVAVDEARILEHWRRGTAPPLEALDDPRLRRRLMTQALETRVIRREVARRSIAPDPQRFEEMLRLAAAGHRLESAPGPEVLAASQALADVDAGLTARFSAPAARVRQVGRDILDADLLADALLAEVPDQTLRDAWLARNTRIGLDLVRVPRVPTSSEIDRAIAERRPEIEAYFEQNQRLYRVPERAFVRRLLVPVAPDADPAARAAAKARADALRAEITQALTADPGAFEAIIRREAPPREARRGGRLAMTRERMPAAFEIEPEALRDGPGPLSPVSATEGGWHVYRVEGRAPAVERTLDDVRVQREIAAELLRKADALPAARRTAGRVAQLLGQNADGPALAALVAEARLIRKTIGPFAAAGPAVVPEVGIAPALFEAVFNLTPEAPVTAVIPVRQHYVVARLVSREAPDPAAWPAVRARFAAEWKGQQRSRVVDEWLSARLKGRPLWIDTPALLALDLSPVPAP